MQPVLYLLLFAVVSFVQNMFFTMSGRSRVSGDPDHHRRCAWGSNGVWFICNILIIKTIWSAINTGQWWFIAAAGIIYVIATTEGSVFMMKRMLKTETGARRPGAKSKGGIAK